MKKKTKVALGTGATVVITKADGTAQTQHNENNVANLTFTSLVTPNNVYKVLVETGN